MGILKKITKGQVNKERLQHIENYELGLFSLVNPSCKGMLKTNPIAGEIALKVLKELREEVEALEVEPKEIDCNRIYTVGADTTETEKFIKHAGDGFLYSRYINDYKRMIEEKEIEAVFPREERVAKIKELEGQISRELIKASTVGKVNRGLKNQCEARAEELRAELKSIEKTLEAPTEEVINNMLYMLCVGKIAEIKNRIEFKINYLEGVLTNE